MSLDAKQAKSYIIPGQNRKDKQVYQATHASTVNVTGNGIVPSQESKCRRLKSKDKNTSLYIITIFSDLNSKLIADMDKIKHTKSCHFRFLSLDVNPARFSDSFHDDRLSYTKLDSFIGRRYLVIARLLLSQIPDNSNNCNVDKLSYLNHCCLVIVDVIVIGVIYKIKGANLVGTQINTKM